MNDKLKNILSKKLFYVILGIVIVGTIEIVYASNLINSKNVSYSNSSSKLSSTNVQGAIDELYNSCKDIKEQCPDNKICFDKTPKNYLRQFIVTSGDGLYLDETESNKYFYRGKNAKNYINFNDELWRIVTLENDGTMKIVRDQPIGQMAYDTSNSNKWSSSSLASYLNSSYYNSLSTSARNEIIKHSWNTGEVSWNEKGSMNDLLNYEKSSNWQGNIALLNISEYIRTNSNISSCGTHGNYQNNTQVCSKTTWFNYNIVDHSSWLLAPFSQNSNWDWIISSIDSGIYFQDINVNRTAFNVFPTLYIKSNVTLNGIGSKENPIKINYQ